LRDSANQSHYQGVGARLGLRVIENSINPPSMQDHEEFEVETDQPGEWPMPFCSETVKTVLVD